MKTTERNRIHDLARHGLTANEIAAEMNMNSETIRSFLRRHPLPSDTSVCKNCGTHIEQVPGRKAVMFCCNKCKTSWWNKRKYSRTSCIQTNCICCGKAITSYKSDNRKYCSQKCYQNARHSTEFKIRKLAV